MTPGFAARRRAEEFNSLVEGTSTVESDGSRYADVLELVATLRDSTPVEPRAEFVAGLRRQLMAEAATALTPATAALSLSSQRDFAERPLAPQRTRRERRLAIAIGGFAVVSATSSMAVAAQTALPGDTLYPLKRALENASTTLQVDEESKGATLLEHASGRLDEVSELTREREPDADVVTDTLHAFSEQAASASDLMIAAYAAEGRESDIAELRSFTAESMSALTDLEKVVPEEARAALIEAAQVLNVIDAQAFRLCPSCGGGSVQYLQLSPANDGVAAPDEVLRPLAASEPTKPAPKAASPRHQDPRSDETETPREAKRPGAEVPSAVPGDAPEEASPPVGIAPAPRDGNGSMGAGDAGVVEDLTDRLAEGGLRNLTEGAGSALDDLAP